MTEPNIPLQVRIPSPAQLRSSGGPTDLTPSVRATAQPHPATEPQPPTTFFGKLGRKIQLLLGYAGPTRTARRERRELVRYLVVVGICLVQITLILVLTALSAVRKSEHPDSPGQTEFQACSVLGVFNIIWLAKLILLCYLESWFIYERRKRRARIAARSQTQLSQHEHPANANAALNPPDLGPSRTDPLCPLTSFRSIRSMLLRLDPFATILWFFITILLVYAHGSHCREAAKDISATTYTILIILYLQFINATVVPMFMSVRARRRSTPPPADKLSRSEVDRIPLVLYIPPPPTDTPASPITPLPRALTHPPVARPLPPPSRRLRRFIFFRPTRKQKLNQDQNQNQNRDVERGEVMSPIEDTDEWDRTFEPAPYPFVRLAENRATCMICLAEFEAPRRLTSSGRAQNADGDKDDGDGDETHEMAELTHSHTHGDGDGEIEEVRVESPRAGDARAVQLADSGSSDAPEPLRLLTCGHVYHKDCVDPWLTTKSGSCPYCRARVTVPPPPSKRGRRRGTV